MDPANVRPREHKFQCVQLVKMSSGTVDRHPQDKLVRCLRQEWEDLVLSLSEIYSNHSSRYFEHDKTSGCGIVCGHREGRAALGNCSCQDLCYKGMVLLGNVTCWCQYRNKWLKFSFSTNPLTHVTLIPRYVCISIYILYIHLYSSTNFHTPNLSTWNCKQFIQQTRIKIII